MNNATDFAIRPNKRNVSTLLVRGPRVKPGPSHGHSSKAVDERPIRWLHSTRSRRTTATSATSYYQLESRAIEREGADAVYRRRVCYLRTSPLHRNVKLLDVALLKFVHASWGTCCGILEARNTFAS